MFKAVALLLYMRMSSFLSFFQVSVIIRIFLLYNIQKVSLFFEVRTPVDYVKGHSNEVFDTHHALQYIAGFYKGMKPFQH